MNVGNWCALGIAAPEGEKTHTSKSRSTCRPKSNMTGAEISTLWKMHSDRRSGAKYFYNVRTREVQWDPPKMNISAEAGVEWKCTIDPESGEEIRPQFFNSIVHHGTQRMM